MCMGLLNMLYNGAFHDPIWLVSGFCLVFICIVSRRRLKPFGLEFRS